MMLTVVMPSLAGIIVHFVFGERKIHSLRAALKLANYVVLLLLNYSNASIALPQAFGNPDVDFLVFIYSNYIRTLRSGLWRRLAAFSMAEGK